MNVPRLVILRDAAGPRVIERHGDDVPFDVEERALKVAAAFGPRPPGVACPGALLRLPAGDGHSEFLVRVADVPADTADPPLKFSCEIRPLLESRADPFDGAAVARTVGAVRERLRTGDGPLWLGATQAVLDGCKVGVVRAAPAEDIVRGVWALLPDRNRETLSFATFAFSAELNFDVAVYAALPGGRFLTEDQCRDYPEGRYELAVQAAAEGGDQAELDRLFARKTSGDVVKLASGLLLFAVAAALALRFI